MDNYELVRRKYKPKEIRVLFIAESRPDNGQFIYDANSGLFDSMLIAFSDVFTQINRSNFLGFMKTNGYYLDDLCLIPVNKMDNAQRNIERENGVKELSDRLKSHKPDHILCIMKDIVPFVDKAIQISKIKTLEVSSTSFPGFSKRNKVKFHDDVVNFIDPVRLNEVRHTHGYL